MTNLAIVWDEIGDAHCFGQKRSIWKIVVGIGANPSATVVLNHERSFGGRVFWLVNHSADFEAVTDRNLTLGKLTLIRARME